MKKTALIISGFILVLIIIYFGIIISLGAPFDREKSEYYQMSPPENLVRTIHNPTAGHFTSFLKKAHETDGEYTLLEIQLEPGGSNAPHYHQSFSETFISVSGTTGVYINGSKYHLSEGESMIAEAGDTHYFFNDTDETITFEVKIEPGSPGFEKALYILYGLANDGLSDDEGTPNDIKHTALFAAYSDTRASGPLRILNPIMSRLAGKAQREGIEAELLERYYLSMVQEEEAEAETAFEADTEADAS
ncbi:MAG: cupin domain-containing protein [Balneolales bacterium]|nr:cupin domain-containing protein [Balneolales bacterium]